MTTLYDLRAELHYLRNTLASAQSRLDGTQCAIRRMALACEVTRRFVPIDARRELDVTLERELRELR